MIRTSRPPSVHSTNTETGDPFAVLLRPPATETDHERVLRLQREADAKRVNDSIDEQIRLDRERYKKSKQDVKLLLLGQAESGKSTLQKQFQLMYNPNSLEEERLSWRTVIYYNIARPVRRILDTLDLYGDEPDLDDDDAFTAISGSPGSRLAGSGQSFEPSSSFSPASADTQLAALRARLSPLLSAELSLAERLSGGVNVSGSGKGSIFVRSGWQARTFGMAFGKARTNSGRASIDQRRPSVDYGGQGADGQGESEKDKLAEEVGKILIECQDDVRELWQHPSVQRLRARRKLKLEEWAEYFLNSISRVSSPGYIPTTDDILHARIQTMGVAEHIFDVSLHGRTVTWHLFDVGGARGQRHTWVPYFDDATAIIFVAPVSAFDQYLDEDPRTNRVDDSLQLFKQICSNPLLKNAHLVLFLNKTDILHAKLARGVNVKKYITSYGDRPNEFDAVVNYFRAHFTQVHKRNNENNRVLYTHLTSVVDTKTTQSIITNVRDSIFRGYLKSAALV
ncbi:heterotrimeric G-protein alpha subunit [Gelatoporia subvermispora B]|uniref:Heterotrimeric G-protein alpha subunit n=1 Tax=Ceriporiopsis subvermispora (strain B) TaxID=914234 RepID=M2QXV0_CERS8|nr:heterotrimeric G-protein alpha subunit [Gelatoporia subvermispora B]